jgi:D-glycero-alpha-D-manno-heptose-7-phosphate kinase
MKMKIRAKAPTRIDLAGGTVDIWPLYLFLKRPTTINLAIDLFAETELVSSKKEKGITLQALDQKVEMKIDWSDFEVMDESAIEKNVHPAVSLHFRYLKYFTSRMKKLPKDGIIIRTRAKSPAGAGLGGSSTLSVSIVGALQKWAFGKFNVEKSGESLTEITRDVETKVIKVPAGLQDYYGAMFGGVQSLRWGPAQHERQRLPRKLIPELEKRVILFYSGQSRNSGINNWSLFKAFIDQDPKVQDLFHGISAATLDLESSLLKGDWAGVGKAISTEWSHRKQLAKGITTSEIDEAFKLGMKFGATAGKICGAGGGGCFFVYAPSADPKSRKKIISEVSKLKNVIHLPFNGVEKGLILSE